MLSPPERTITVNDAPVLNADFAQARVSVSGHVKCIRSPCDASIKVELTPVSGAAAAGGRKARSANIQPDGTFSFVDVVPGAHRVTVVHDWWCWAKASVDINVDVTDIAGVEFVQSGFTLHSVLSHDITLNFSLRST